MIFDDDLKKIFIKKQGQRWKWPIINRMTLRKIYNKPILGCLIEKILEYQKSLQRQNESPEKDHI